MFAKSMITVDTGVAEEVIKLYKDLDNARGGAYGTWHSRRIRTNPYPWFEDTFNRVAAAVSDLTIDEWWFNCGEPLDEYRWHTHSPYAWAGVLYIQTPENCGGIEFRQQEEYYTHTPQAGEFLLFSGNLAHRVLKNNSTDYRISVAFNFKR
jgi:hypothetical protein